MPSSSSPRVRTKAIIMHSRLELENLLKDFLFSGRVPPLKMVPWLHTQDGFFCLLLVIGKLSLACADVCWSTWRKAHRWRAGLTMVPGDSINSQERFQLSPWFVVRLVSPFALVTGSDKDCRPNEKLTTTRRGEEKIGKQMHGFPSLCVPVLAD